MSNTITFPKKVCIFKDEGGKMMQLEMLNFHILLLTHGMGVCLDVDTEFVRQIGLLNSLG